MISYDIRRLSETPILSIIFAITPDFTDRLDMLERYFIEWDFLDVELIAGVVKDEPFKEQAAKNGAVSQATTNYVAFTNGGVYPPPTLVGWTRRVLDDHPEAFVQAYRLDGTRDNGVFVNPFAVGDWQAMTKETFGKLGGYDENLLNGAGIDTDMLSRAVAAELPIAISNERVFHAWHDSHRPDSEYQEAAEKNMAAIRAKGLEPLIICHPQQPRHPRYTECVQIDKMRRVGRDVFSVVTDHPVATDSPDNTHPDGAVRSSRMGGFLEGLEQVLGRELRVLDLGCGLGQRVAELLERGHTAIGLDGCEAPCKNGLGAWRTLSDDRLFLSDIGYPFQVIRNGQACNFDVITAWDVLEHIPEARLDAVMENIVRHLADEGRLIVTIASDSSAKDGIERHQTIKPQEWWDRLLSEYLVPETSFSVDMTRAVGQSWPVKIYTLGRDR